MSGAMRSGGGGRLLDVERGRMVPVGTRKAKIARLLGIIVKEETC